jgi:hypothetical protein
VKVIIIKNVNNPNIPAVGMHVNIIQAKGVRLLIETGGNRWWIPKKNVKIVKKNA